MGGGKIWLVIGAMAAIAVMALGWFVAAAPQLEAAAAADLQRATVAQTNAQEEAKLAAMRALDERMDELLAEYATLSTSVPNSADLEGYFDWVAAAAGASAITLTSVTAASSVPYERLPNAVGTVQLDADFASQLRLVQIDMSIGGTAEQVSAFLRILQTDGRLQLFHSTTANFGSTLTSRISGFIFVSKGPAVPIGASDSADDAEPGADAGPGGAVDSGEDGADTDAGGESGA